jgi:membrane-bound lytic murein transglycosylase F
MRSFLAQLRPRLTGIRRPWRIAGAAAAALLAGTCSQPPSVLDQIRTTGVLKVVTRNSPTAYYLGVEGPEGPEYELAAGFARWLGVQVAFTVAPSETEALNEILRNRAHVAAAGIIVSGERRARLSFGPVYQTVKQHVVHRQRQRAPREAAHLVGKRIEVVAGSTHVEALAALARDTPGLEFVEVPNVDQLDLFDRVSSGDIDYTIADSTEFSIGRHLHPDLRTAFELAQSESIAWALSPRDGSLLSPVNRYFDSLTQHGTLASILQRYYAAADRFDYVDSLNFVRIVRERLPALRPFFEEAALATGFDWRLLAAIGYQESKFAPGATSPTGVRGIMMLTEDTASRVGVHDRLDPRSSILGGARYLKEVRGKVPGRIPEPDRTWLALAAYNIGFGHLEDARVLVQRRGGNPDSWGDVRRSLPLLAQERWYLQARNGYARGWEPVRFVDNINNYRDVLVWMTGDPGNELRLAAAKPPPQEAD